MKEENRVKRLEFPTEYAETMNYSKTSSLLMRAAFGLTDSKLCFRKIGQPKKMKPTPKHPYKVHIWAEISMKGATPINFGDNCAQVLLCRRDPPKYPASLCQGDLSGQRLLILQDTDPKHTTK